MEPREKMDKSSEYVICMKMRQTERITIDEESVLEKKDRGRSGASVVREPEELTFHELLLLLCERMLRINRAFVNILGEIHMGEILKRQPGTNKTKERGDEKVTNSSSVPLGKVKN